MKPKGATNFIDYYYVVYIVCINAHNKNIHRRTIQTCNKPLGKYTKIVYKYMHLQENHVVTYFMTWKREHNNSPLADNFFVFIIFAANSKPVDFCTHLLTTEKAPLKQKIRQY